MRLMLIQGLGGDRTGASSIRPQPLRDGVSAGRMSVDDLFFEESVIDSFGICKGFGGGGVLDRKRRMVGVLTHPIKRVAGHSGSSNNGTESAVKLFPLTKTKTIYHYY